MKVPSSLSSLLLLLLLLLVAVVVVESSSWEQLPNVGLKYAREPSISQQTPLDSYSWAYDGTAGFSVDNVTYSGRGFTAYVLNFNSQTWMPAQSSQPLWQHWLTVCVPHASVVQSTGFLWMDGPSNQPRPSKELYAPVDLMCSSMDGVVVYLPQCPNQPLHFPDHPGGLKEDDLIAYGWRKFLNESRQNPPANPQWLMRLPMTKAGVNAMTAAQVFIGKRFPNIKLNDFIVSGASKRGWNTWTVAAVDARVRAAVPVVMPIPNIVKNIGSEYRAYGNFSFALKPYLDQQITEYLYANPNGMQSIADIVDPLVYFKRYTFPVWSVTAAADEFTLPDSPRWWYHQLPPGGEKFLRIIPNAEHSLFDVILNLVSDMAAYYYMLTRNIPRPVVTWDLGYSQDLANITLRSSNGVPPTNVVAWYADTIPGRGRDFRWIYCASVKCLEPVIWFPKPVKANLDGSYSFSRAKPVVGWSGFLLEAEYNIPNDLNVTLSLRVSTEVNVVPDVFPFEQCPPNQCDTPPS